MIVDWKCILPSLSVKCVTQLLRYLVFPGNLPHKAFLLWIKLNHIVSVINKSFNVGIINYLEVTLCLLLNKL